MSSIIKVESEKTCECNHPTLQAPDNHNEHAKCYCENCNGLLTVHHKIKGLINKSRRFR